MAGTSLASQIRPAERSPATTGTGELKAGLQNLTYSLVIPAYNEGARLAPTLERVLGYIARHECDAEVIVVNDGSRDNTADLVRSFAQNHPGLRLVENPGNRGKGYSVRNGVLHARGRVVLFTDADLSSPIEEVPKLLQALAAGADIAIGSRWLQAELQTRRQSLHRQLFGRIFNLLLRITLGLHFKDTQCGFKAFRQRAALAVFPLQKIEGWGFDPEILFLARKFGLKVQEVPVVWAHDGGTRINPIADGARMFVEMLRIRWYDLRGKYNPSSPQPQPVKTLPEVRDPNV
jgi:dolichyl-phosphate beta-glucosyltransferase